MTETTAVYVDGYNVYYGRIRGTPYKWIDVVRLFERLVHEQTPTSQMTVVRYFSAFCLARFSTHGNASTIAQDSFLRGHEARHGSRFRRQWEPTRMIAAVRKCRGMSMGSPSTGQIG